MHQIHILTNYLSSVKLRPKNLANARKLYIEDIQANTFLSMKRQYGNIHVN
jgi:hypothetical protein